MPPLISDLEIARRLLLAAAVGGILGAEREFRGKSAGFRTNILIAMGAALFTVLSLTLDVTRGDPARIAAQVLVGVGFIGGGAIIRTRGEVHGLTTAATVWVNAALGMAAGAAQYHLAMLGATITLVVLLILAPFERILERRYVSRPANDRRA